jgi:hypothetical protein
VLAVSPHDRPDRPDRPDVAPDEPAWSTAVEGEEPEPDWAEKIRSGRKDRGARLREVYSRFPDEKTPLDDPPPPEDRRPPDDAEARP